MCLERIDVRNFLEEFGFRSDSSLAATGGDLQVKMTYSGDVSIVIFKFMAPFHKQSGNLNTFETRRNSGCFPRNGNVEVRPKMNHEIVADSSVRIAGNALKRVESDPRALNRCQCQDDSATCGDRDNSLVCLHCRDTQFRTLRHRYQAIHMTARHNHEALKYIIPDTIDNRRLLIRFARCFD